jgi:hypothetical protein
MSLDRSSTSDREIERIVRSWLTEGTTRLPDRVLDAVLDEVPSTPQRRAWWPAWRFDTMSNAMRIAIAAAAVLVVALIAIYVLPGGNNGIGNPAATPTPSPTPSVTVSAGALIDIVLAPDSPPPGLSHDQTVAGRDALGRPIISRATTDAERSQPGFVDGRYSEFSNDSSGFLSWAILFETVGDAERSYDFYLSEVQSEAGYGLGPSPEAGLGDEGICGIEDPSDPSSTQVCLWRSGGLVLAVGTYGPIDETTVRDIAEGMQARAARAQ